MQTYPNVSHSGERRALRDSRSYVEGGEVHFDRIAEDNLQFLLRRRTLDSFGDLGFRNVSLAEARRDRRERLPAMRGSSSTGAGG